MIDGHHNRDAVSLLALVFTPYLSYIPSEAVGPVVVATGASMALAARDTMVDFNSQRCEWLDKALEWLPLIVLITV
ncbi:MAG: hypothetical protein U5K84_03410 [Alkalibacterium sp.]|nr:hypothetical protein [Alkalibacterium sp.]